MSWLESNTLVHSKIENVEMYVNIKQAIHHIYDFYIEVIDYGNLLFC